MLSCPWSQCSEDFDDKDDLRDHVSSSHLKYFPYRCQLCNVIFPSRGQVDYHWSSDHQDQGQPMVSCCLNRQKEKCLKEILSPLDGIMSPQESIHEYPSTSSSAALPPSISSSSKPSNGYYSQLLQPSIASRHHDDGSRSAITAQLEPKYEISEFDSLTERQKKRRRRRPADDEDSRALDALEMFAAPSAHRSFNDLQSSSAIEHQGTQEQGFTPEFDGTIPEHLVDIAWDMTMKRKALIGAPIDARFKYFVAQLAMSVPAMSSKEIGESARVQQRSTIAELLGLQAYPTNEALYSALDKFASEVPVDETRRVELVVSACQHLKKLCSMRQTRDKRRQSGAAEPGRSTKRGRSLDDDSVIIY